MFESFSLELEQEIARYAISKFQKGFSCELNYFWNKNALNNLILILLKNLRVSMASNLLLHDFRDLSFQSPDLSDLYLSRSLSDRKFSWKFSINMNGESYSNIAKQVP